MGLSLRLKGPRGFGTIGFRSFRLQDMLGLLGYCSLKIGRV